MASNSTYVSFYLSSNTIRIFKSTVRFLGTPPFLQFRIHYDGESMILEPHEIRTFTTLRVPKNIYTEQGSMEVHSKGLCRLLANKLNWDINCSYRIPGKLIPQQKIVIFDLSKATVIPQSSSYNPDLYLRNERVVYEYEDGSFSDKLPRRIHEGMFTDSILFGEELELRFFLYFNAIHLYKCRVEELKFISEREEYCHIQCFGEHVTLMPGQEIVLKKKKQTDDFEPQ